MTRKHFEAAARIVRDQVTEDTANFESRDLVTTAQILADAFIDLFQQFSPNFDRARFLKACGL